MLESLLDTSTNVFCQYCPRREGRQRGQSWGASAKLPDRRPPPHWTGRGLLNEGVMSGELRVLLFVCFSSVHGWMGMDLWVNVLTMPFLCAVSGPWRNLESCWKCWSMCWTHLQMFSVSIVLVEKASDVEQSWGAGAKLPGRRPPPHWTVRGPVKEGVMFGELSFLQLLFFVEECAWMFGNRWVSECLEDAFFF